MRSLALSIRWCPIGDDSMAINVVLDYYCAIDSFVMMKEETTFELELAGL